MEMADQLLAALSQLDEKAMGVFPIREGLKTDVTDAVYARTDNRNCVDSSCSGYETFGTTNGSR